MMKDNAIRNPGVLLLAVSLTGCASYYRVAGVYKTSSVPDAQGRSFFDSKAGQVDTESKAFADALSKARAATPLGKMDRNSLIAQLYIASDEMCQTHKAEIQAMSNKLNLTFGTLTTLFSGAASVISHAGTAKELSAAAAASNSSRSLLNAEIYQQAFSIAIVNAIDSERATKKTAIDNKMALATDQYPIEVAMGDINQYHNSCSFISGLAVISKAVQQRPQAKATILDRIGLLREQMDQNLTKISQATADPTAADVYKANNQELMKQITALQSQLNSAPE